MSWTKIMECVPNFSEGRDLQKIDEIVSPFRAKAGVKLLDYSNDEDHNRLVVTVVGEPDALKEAVIEAIGIAVELIDLNHHQGQHPRMGAVDVVPFIPIKGCTMEDAIAVSKEVGQRVASQYNLPVFLYEKSASAPHRENLAAIRKGEFEGMKEKIHQPEWHPDFGPAERHPTAGTVAIGARMQAYDEFSLVIELLHHFKLFFQIHGSGAEYGSTGLGTESQLLGNEAAGIQNEVGAFQHLASAYGNQVRVARAGAHYFDVALAHSSYVEGGGHGIVLSFLLGHQQPGVVCTQ